MMYNSLILIAARASLADGREPSLFGDLRLI